MKFLRSKKGLTILTLIWFAIFPFHHFCPVCCQLQVWIGVPVGTIAAILDLSKIKTRYERDMYRLNKGLIKEDDGGV